MQEQDPSNNTQSSVQLSDGTIVGHYRVTKRIGAGGMGEVYLAQDTSLARPVALKFLPAHLTGDDQFRRRFTREAQAAAGLNHPNIVTVYEVGDHQGRPYMAMELVEGRSLRDVIAKPDLSLGRQLDLVISILNGLQATHEAGMTHRDIKPSNIMIDRKDRPRLVDFGLATVPGADHLTRTGSTLGTIGYMSPEQIQSGPTDHRSDLFSLGVVLYELVTGRHPFFRDNDAATLQAILHATPAPLKSCRPDMPDALQHIVDRALAKDINARYESADRMRNDLQNLLDSLAPTRTVAAAPARARRRAAWIAAGVLIVATAVVLLLIKPWSSPEILPPDKTMLAVLPFENLGNPDDEYFADGMTEEIISRLASVSGLGVISRTTMIGYKNTTKPLKQIGQELGVEYVLEGTVRFDKNMHPPRVRITPQLIRVADDVHLWADQIEMPLENIFQAQAQIAKGIVAALDVRLVQGEPEWIERIPTQSTEAYQLLLQVRHILDEASDRADRDSAISLLQHALKLDSSIVIAWAAMSVAHSQVYHFGYDQTPARIALAKATARQAVRLDPNSPEAQYALGTFYYACERDYNQALAEFEKTLAAPSCLWDPTLNVAYILRRQGKFSEAAERQLKFFRLNPRDADAAGQLGLTYQVLREYEKADEYYRRATALEPVYYAEVAANIRKWTGDVAAARAELERMPERSIRAWVFQYYFERNRDGMLACIDSLGVAVIENQEFYWPIELAYAIVYRSFGGDSAETALFERARQILEARLLETPSDFRVHDALGLTYAGLGQRTEALRHADRAVELYPVERDALLGPTPVSSRGRVFIFLGEYDKAIDVIEQLLKMPAGGVVSAPILRIDPLFDPLRNLPRFQMIVKS